MREKLIELLNQGADNTPCDRDCWDKKCNDCIRETQADHLVTNGVTIQKWIPVTERLPDVARRVIVTDGQNISFGYVLNYERKDWNPWCTQYPVIYDKITHWMPLPEAPKGE